MAYYYTNHQRTELFEDSNNLQTPTREKKDVRFPTSELLYARRIVNGWGFPRTS
jgi:hypothetical protein